MKEQTATQFGAGLAARFSVLAPDWLRAMLWGLPLARRITLIEDGAKPRRGTLPASALTTPPETPAKRRARVVDLVVPGKLLLERRIVAPRGAQGRLAAMAALDLRQRTPFAPGDVYTLLGAPSTKDDTLTVPQWVAKRSDVTEWRRNLAARGVRLRRLHVAGQRKALADFTAELAPGARRVRLLNGALAMLAVGACLWAWLYPAWVARDQAMALDRQLIALRAEALQLRQTVEAARARDGERAAFLQTVLRRPLMVDTLREMTVALPDTVWLEALVFTPDRAVLNGEVQGSAADLVLGLGARPGLGNPRLSGPVSRTATGAERFEITLDLGAGQ